MSGLVSPERAQRTPEVLEARDDLVLNVLEWSSLRLALVLAIERRHATDGYPTSSTGKARLPAVFNRPRRGVTLLLCVPFVRRRADSPRIGSRAPHGLSLIVEEVGLAPEQLEQFLVRGDAVVWLGDE